MRARFANGIIAATMIFSLTGCTSSANYHPFWNSWSSKSKPSPTTSLANVPPGPGLPSGGGAAGGTAPPYGATGAAAAPYGSQVAATSYPTNPYPVSSATGATPYQNSSPYPTTSYPTATSTTGMYTTTPPANTAVGTYAGSNATMPQNGPYGAGSSAGGSMIVNNSGVPNAGGYNNYTGGAAGYSAQGNSAPGATGAAIPGGYGGAPSAAAGTGSYAGAAPPSDPYGPSNFGAPQTAAPRSAAPSDSTYTASSNNRGYPAAGMNDRNYTTGSPYDNNTSAGPDRIGASRTEADASRQPSTERGNWATAPRESYGGAAASGPSGGPPSDYSRDPRAYTPGQNGYTPGDNGYTPGDNGYTPSGSYPPSPNQGTAPSGGYRPGGTSDYNPSGARRASIIGSTDGSSNGASGVTPASYDAATYGAPGSSAVEAASSTVTSSYGSSSDYSTSADTASGTGIRTSRGGASGAIYR